MVQLKPIIATPILLVLANFSLADESIVDALDRQLKHQNSLKLIFQKHFHKDNNLNEPKSTTEPNILTTKPVLEDLSKLSKECEKCLEEFHEQSKKTLIRAEHNKTLRVCLIKALSENSEIKECLEKNSDVNESDAWEKCIFTKRVIKKYVNN